MSTPIALQMWSLNQLCKEDFTGALKKVSAMGYDGVEFAGFGNLPATELKKIVAELGLGIAGSHTGLHLLRDNFDEVTDYNLELGNKMVIVPAVPNEIRETADTWKAFADEMCELNQKISAKGLTLGYHNHDFEFDDKNGQVPFDIVFSNTPKEVVMQVDMGWSFRAGVDARELFKKYPGRSESVHVKAYSASVDTACLGEDDVPWAEVLPVAVSTGEAKWFVVEHERHEGDPLKNVETCLTYLKGLR